MEQPMHVRYPEKFARVSQNISALRRPSYEVSVTDAAELQKCKAQALEMTDILFINGVLGGDRPILEELLTEKPASDVKHLCDVMLEPTNIIGYGLVSRQLKSQEDVETPRLAVVTLPRVVKEERVVCEGEVYCMINPCITHMTDLRRYRQEGCLSSPGVYYNTDRHMRLTVGFLDLKRLLVDADPVKAAREIEFQGIEAVIMQHELDHHDGKLIVDRARLPITSAKVVPNEPCPECLAGGKTLKWKKCTVHNKGK